MFCAYTAGEDNLQYFNNVRRAIEYMQPYNPNNPEHHQEAVPVQFPGRRRRRRRDFDSPEDIARLLLPFIIPPYYTYPYYPYYPPYPPYPYYSYPYGYGYGGYRPVLAENAGEDPEEA